MIKIINCNRNNYKKKLITLLEKRRSGKDAVSKIVVKILKDIKNNGNKALLKYERRLSKNSNIISTKNEINKAIRKLDPKVRKAIDFAYNKILNFHKKQLNNQKNIIYKDKLKNKLEYRSIPIQNLGIYCPQGLPTSLLMTATLARLAKVKNIAFDVTPAKYVTGLITEKGVCEASEKGLKGLFK